MPLYAHGAPCVHAGMGQPCMPVLGVCWILSTYRFPAASCMVTSGWPAVTLLWVSGRAQGCWRLLGPLQSSSFDDSSSEPSISSGAGTIKGVIMLLAAACLGYGGKSGLGRLCNIPRENCCLCRIGPTTTGRRRLLALSSCRQGWCRSCLCATILQNTLCVSISSMCACSTGHQLPRSGCTFIARVHEQLMLV